MSEALRLADECESDVQTEDCDCQRCELFRNAAQELRRLDALNEELMDVLKAFSDYVHAEQSATDGAVSYSTTAINHWAFLARAAVAKGEGMK